MVVLDLELVSVRTAPGIVVTQPAPYRSNVVSVEVMESHDPPLPILPPPPPSSANTYRIPRIPDVASYSNGTATAQLLSR